LRFESRGGRLVAHHHGIAPEQLARVARKAALEAIGKETDRGEGRDCQRHRDDQQAQFAGAQIAQQRAPAQREGGGAFHG
jgi:hypothetical protein